MQCGVSGCHFPEKRSIGVVCVTHVPQAPVFQKATLLRLYCRALHAQVDDVQEMTVS